MSDDKWTAIIYGRSYKVDFSFIALPQDFKIQNSHWALDHIITTTRSANKLSGNPRWSLFKNESHCVVGVTCMVRDLIGNYTTINSDNMTKDIQGRPLYIFVGYVTQLQSKQDIPKIPVYSGKNLDFFQPLYEHVRSIWYIQDYQKFNKLPILTDYQKINYPQKQTINYYDRILANKLNHQYKAPESIFLWQDSDEYRQKLWSTAARCQSPISLCLGLTTEQDLINTPFLNGTVDRIQGKNDRSSSNINSSIYEPKSKLNLYKSACELNNNPHKLKLNFQSSFGKIKEQLSLLNQDLKIKNSSEDRSFLEAIQTKIQADIKTTIQQLEKANILTQELIDSLYSFNNTNESIDLSTTQTKQSEPEQQPFEFQDKLNESNLSNYNLDRTNSSANQWRKTSKQWFE